MALKAFGTNLTTSLTVLAAWTPQTAIADIASIATNIKDDLNVAHPIVPGAFAAGRLVVPNRGFLLLQPGDYVAYDSTGWPYLVSAAAKAAVWTIAP